MAFVNQGRHVSMVGVVDPETLGGTEEYRTDNGIDYKIHTFTTSGIFEVTGSKPVTMEILSVAGGGAGGGGGGGAGGMVVETVALDAGILDGIKSSEITKAGWAKESADEKQGILRFKFK